MWTQTIILALVAASVLAGPINVKTPIFEPSENFGNQCSRTCPDKSQKFQYLPGNVYSYSYQVDSRTLIDGASEEHAGVRINAQAEVEVISPCEFVLKMTNVQLKEKDPRSLEKLTSVEGETRFKRDLETLPLRFGFVDGRIDDVCPEPTESTWALNFKRGLLSALQNNMASLERGVEVRERDVTGECKTLYVVKKHDRLQMTVEKSKNMLSCTDRQDAVSAIQSMSYRVPSEIQSLPLLDSKHKCQQEVHNGLVQSVVCEEEHIFRPFSTHSVVPLLRRHHLQLHTNADAALPTPEGLRRVGCQHPVRPAAIAPPTAATATAADHPPSNGAE